MEARISKEAFRETASGAGLGNRSLSFDNDGVRKVSTLGRADELSTPPESALG